MADIELTFSQYADIAEFLADTQYSAIERVNEALMDIVSDVVDSAIGETKSLRYHYNHGSNGASTISITNLRPFGSNKQEVWIEFRIRWSTNFTTEWSGPGGIDYPNDHKLFFIGTSSALSGRVALYVGNGSGTHAVRVERPSASGGTGDYALSPGGEPTAETLWASDTWHTIRIYFKCSTTDSSGDGAFKVWIDGNLYHNESGFSHAASEGGADRLESISFARNKDDGPENTDMYIWWSRIQVDFTAPAWDGGGGGGEVAEPTFRSIGNGAEANGTTVSAAFTLTEGDVLYALVATVNSESPTSVFWNTNEAMTAVAPTQNQDAGGGRALTLYRLVGGTPGAFNITANQTPAQFIAVVGFSYSGVDTTTPEDGVVTDAEAPTDQSLSVTITSPAGDKAVVGAVSAEESVVFTASNGTKQGQPATANCRFHLIDRSGLDGATLIDGSFDANPFGFTTVGMNLNAAPEGGGGGGTSHHYKSKRRHRMAA